MCPRHRFALGGRWLSDWLTLLAKDDFFPPSLTGCLNTYDNGTLKKLILYF